MDAVRRSFDCELRSENDDYGFDENLHGGGREQACCSRCLVPGVAEVVGALAVDEEDTLGDPNLAAGVVLRVQRVDAARSDHNVVDVASTRPDWHGVDDVPAIGELAQTTSNLLFAVSTDSPCALVGVDAKNSRQERLHWGLFSSFDRLSTRVLSGLVAREVDPRVCGVAAHPASPMGTSRAGDTAGTTSCALRSFAVTSVPRSSVESRAINT